MDRLLRLTALLSLGFMGCTSADRPAPMDKVSFIVADEFDAYPLVEGRLGEIAGYPQVAVCLAVRPDEHRSPELESALRAAARQRVPVIAWMLLPESEGYWYNEENLVAAREHTLDFLAWIEDRGIPLAWLLFDMELGLEESLLLRGGDLFGVVLPTLQANVDPEAFAQATSGYTALVREVQARGFVVTAAAYPFVLDDLDDGDAEIQDAFNTPVAGVPFDEIYFMVYRTTFATLMGAEPGPDLVYQYAREARLRFGSRGIVGLGTIGSAGVVSETGYTRPDQLAADVAAARAGGNRRVFVYSLDGMLSEGSLDAWLHVDATEGARPDPDPTTDEIREILAMLDNLF